MLPLDLGRSVPSSATDGSPATSTVEVPELAIVDAAALSVPAVGDDVGVLVRRADGRQLLPLTGYLVTQGIDQRLRIGGQRAIVEEGTELVAEYTNDGADSVRVTLLLELGVPQG